MSNPFGIVVANSIIVPVGSLAVLTVIIVGVAFWLWSLIDALRINDQTWKEAGQSKLVWILVIVLLSLLGSVLYVAVAKRALKRVSTPTTSAGVAD